jgi:uncharacterized Zn-binding protein involved in type VI secretion
MPGCLVHLGAIVLCAHGGQAMPSSSNPRVLVNGQPVATLPTPYTVAGCPFNVGGSPSPCLMGQLVTSATRVLAGGLPVVLFDSQATCVPNGTPLMITSTQPRVMGT